MRSVLALVLVLGCGGGSGDDGPDAGPVADADPSAAAPRFDDSPNLVVVREGSWPGVTGALGQLGAVFATDTSDLLTETMRSGQCRLLTSNAMYCPSDPCPGFCVDDVCHPWPSYRDAGRVTFVGLQTSIGLTFDTGYYAPDSFPIPTELFDAGDPITAAAAGAAAFPAFSLHASGVETFSPTLTGDCDNIWQVARGQDATISWSQPVAGSRIRMRIPSTNNGHGLPPNAVLECEGPDLGQLTVPSALLAAMPDFFTPDSCSGIACVSIDCPPASIARYTGETITVAGESVAFRVESEITFTVDDD
jgi:hypothetical protein